MARVTPIKQDILDMKSLGTLSTSRMPSAKPSRGQDYSAPIGDGTDIMTMAPFLEPGFCFWHVSLEIHVWGICWIMKTEVFNE